MKLSNIIVKKQENLFQISTLSSYSMVTSWNQLKIYQKHIWIFLKFLQNFPKTSSKFSWNFSEFVKNLYKINIGI